MIIPHPLFRVPSYVVLRVNDVGVFLTPGRRTLAMLPITVGHTATLAILYLDQNGNPMITPPTLDSPPVWANTPSTPPVDVFTIAPDSLSATLQATAAGSDTVNLSVVSGGKTFPASLSVSISEAPQVLTSVQISASVS